MKNILVPSDFSESADHALDFAIEIAKDLGAKLFIYNSFKMPNTSRSILKSIDDLLENDSRSGILEIEKKLNTIGLKKDENYVTDYSSGELVDNVYHKVREWNIDLIVMGTKGESGNLEALIGSKTNKIIREVSIPVFVIPPHIQFTKPKSIVFAADYRKINNQVKFNPLLTLITTYTCKLNIVTVIDKDELWDVDKELERIKMKNFFKDNYPGFNTIRNSDVSDGLNEYIKENHSDMLVMLGRENSFFERVFLQSETRNMALQANIPLLVLQDKE